MCVNVCVCVNVCLCECVCERVRVRASVCASVCVVDVVVGGGGGGDGCDGFVLNPAFALQQSRGATSGGQCFSFVNLLFRTADGSCNNQVTRGQSLQPLARLLPPDYDDGQCVTVFRGVGGGGGRGVEGGGGK